MEDNQESLKRISFSIVKQGPNRIYVGLAHTSTVLKNNYIIKDRDKLGHGGYLISSAGFLLHSSDEKLKHKINDFVFE